MELGALDCGTDANDRAARIERLGEQLDHGGTALEQLEQPLAGLELLGSFGVTEQARGAADVQLRARLCDQLDKRWTDSIEECPLARRQLRIVELAPKRAGAEPDTGHPLVQELFGPARQPAIDRVLGLEQSFGDAARGRDQDDHHDPRLQHEHLDVADGR